MNNYSTRQTPLPAPAIAGRVTLSDGRVAKYGNGAPGEVFVDVYESEDSVTPVRMDSVAYEGDTPSRKDLESAIEELLLGKSAETVRTTRRSLLPRIFARFKRGKSSATQKPRR